MRKTKYKFNPETLEYQKLDKSVWGLIAKIIGFSSLVFLIGLISVSLFSDNVSTPSQNKLKNDLSDYELQVKLLNKKTEMLANIVKELEERDNEVYREVFGAEPISKDLKTAGTGGLDKYTSLDKIIGGDKLSNLHKKIDAMAAQVKVQEKSYDELLKLAKAKAKMLASIPAIQPVSNKELRRIASGFGSRIDPIYRMRKMHTGIDFTSPIGAKVYATGDGVVKEVNRERWGYGTHVVINHGYGYQTLYAHLSKTKVRPGQKVKRGELIGNVGSTGKSTGPHLHYEVIRNGDKVDPIGYFYNDLTSQQYEELLKLASNPNQSFD